MRVILHRLRVTKHNLRVHTHIPFINSHSCNLGRMCLWILLILSLWAITKHTCGLVLEGWMVHSEQMFFCSFLRMRCDCEVRFRENWCGLVWWSIEKNWNVLFCRSHLGECGTLSKVWNALFILIWCAYGLESPVWWKNGQMWCNPLTQMHRTLITEGKRKLPPGAVFTATVGVTQHLCWHMMFRFRRRVLKSVPSA